MRDSKEIPIGKENPQKRGKKNRVPPSRTPKEEAGEDASKIEKSACGKILDITI